MTILWHCRGCNELGKTSLDVRQIIQATEGEETVLETVIRIIPHECKDREIGIRSSLAETK